nr:unnamed protein product [Callosobruchus chinensis]
MTIGKGFGRREEDKIDYKLSLLLPLIVAERKYWLLPQWRNVLYSDESRFGLVSDDYRERVWRRRGGQNRLATAIVNFFSASSLPKGEFSFGPNICGKCSGSSLPNTKFASYQNGTPSKLNVRVGVPQGSVLDPIRLNTGRRVRGHQQHCGEKVLGGRVTDESNCPSLDCINCDS